MKNSVDEIRFQIRSVIIVKFFELYKVLEKETKNIFSEEIKNVDEEFKNKLYFLYGGNSNITIDISNSKLYMDPKTFSVNEDFNISNPYNFKSTQEKSSTIESDKFNVNDLQALLFHTTFQTNPSTLDDDLLPENQKLKKQLEEQLNTLLENGDLSDEKNCY